MVRNSSQSSCPLLVLVLALCFLSQTVYAQEEFVGPLGSWANVHTYGAQGNGVADDTTSIQSALSDIGLTNRPSVLYFPAGTYNVSSQLTLAARQGVIIVGESPALVSIKWIGAAGGVLLRVNGVCYSRLSRLTFDGGGTASVLVDQSWDGTQGCFDTGNEYSDDVFSGAPTGTGIRGGNLSFGFAETSVRRTQFLTLNTGIALKNFNALDLWIWDSLFDHCYIGVGNDPGAGNFHVYNSVFRQSGHADNLVGNTGGFSFIGNYSVGPNSFFGSAGVQAPGPTILQANTINNTGVPAFGTTIINGNQGPLVLLDNKVGTSTPGSGTAVNAYTFGSGDTDVISVGNVFATAVGVSTPLGRLLSVDDLTSQTITFTEPTLPATPTNHSRTVFDVPVGASSATIQGIINSAVLVSRSVVHFPFGQYNNVAVTVPPSDIQIVGDGMYTTRVSGTITLQGPASHVIIQDLGMYGTGSGDGIVLNGGDEVGGRVFLQGLNVSASANNILYDGLSNLQLEARDLSHAAAGDTSVKLLGSGTIKVFSAASNGNPLAYSASQGSLLLRDEWWDSGGSAFLSASGTSTVTVAGSHLAGTTSAVILNNFTGTAAILDTLLVTPSNLLISGASTGQIVDAGIVGSTSNYFVNGTAATAALVNSKTTLNPPPGTGSSQISNQGSYSDSLLRASLNQVRTNLPGAINDLSSGLTDVRMYRVGIDHFNVGLHLLPAAPTSLSATVVGTTQTQAVLEISGFTGACTVALSTSNTYAPLHPDVDPSKYTGASTDTGRADTYTRSSGTIRVVTIGHQLADRALAVETTYYYRVSGCGTTATGSFTTPTLALGTNQSWPVPFNSGKWANRDYPFTAADLVTKTERVDPISGLKITPASNALDWTTRWPGGGSNPVSAATAAFAYWDCGSCTGWTNPANVINGGTSTASVTGTNPIDLYLGADANAVTLWPYHQWSLNDIGVKIFGTTSTAGQQFTVCLFLNPTSGCVGTPITISPATGSIAQILSASADPDKPFPSTFPAGDGGTPALFGGWGANVLPGPDNRLRAGTLAVASGVVTIDTPSAASALPSHFSTEVGPGTKIFISGSSAQGCSAADLCTIATVRDAIHATLVQNVSLPTGTSYAVMGFGIRLQRTGSTGTVTVGAKYKLAGTINVNNAGGPEMSKCGQNTFATGDSPPKQARICTVPTSNTGIYLWYFLMDDGTSRPFYGGQIPAASYFTTTLNWNGAGGRPTAADIPNPANTALCCSAFNFAPGVDARTWYVAGANSASPVGVDIWALHYDGDTTEDRDWHYTMDPGGASYIKYPPSNMITWSVVAGSTNTILNQITSLYPSYNQSLYGTGFPFIGTAGDTAYFQNNYNNVQNLPAWVAVADFSSGTAVLTDLYHTMDGSGLSGNIRFSGLHNITPSAKAPDNIQMSRWNLETFDTSKLHGGPFRMPITALQRSGSWSTNLALPWPIDSTYDNACPSGNPYEFAGATGTHCMKIRFPHGGWCNVSPRADEKSTWPCPSPTTPISGWTPTTYAQPFPLRVGDSFFDRNLDGGFSEYFRVVQLFSASEPDGQDSAWVQRNAMTDTCCRDLDNLPGSRCTNGLNQNQHAVTPWIAEASAPALNGCNTTLTSITGTTSSAIVQDVPPSIAGHGDIISGTVAGTLSYVSAAGAIKQATAATYLNIPVGPNTNALSAPRFHGVGLPVGNNAVQAYVSSTGGIPWFSDGNTINNNGGVGREYLDGGTIARDMIATATPNVYKIEVLGTVAAKVFFPIGFAGKFSLRDVSGPSSDITASAYGLCIPYKNGECYAASIAGATGSHGYIFGYVNVPMAYDPAGQCIIAQHWANVPCVISGWPGAGGFRQQNWTAADTISASSRFLTYLMDIPGGQYAFNSMVPLNSSIAWGPPTYVSGWGQISWLAKLPSFPTGTGVSQDFINVPISFGAGSVFAGAEFGYSRFLGPGGSPTGALPCTSRNEGCVTGGSPYSFLTSDGPLIPATSLWGSTIPSNPWQNDPSAVTVLTKITGTDAGVVNGIRFYKGAGNNGIHIGLLYSATGTELARVTFTGETSSGVQYMAFASPVSVAANTVYWAALWTNSGYAADVGYFDNGSFSRSPLTAVLTGYNYGDSPAWQTNLSHANYYVDVDFAETGCTAGCTINIPVMAPNVVYYRPRRSTDGITWTPGDTIAITVNGIVPSGPCSDLTYSPTTASPIAAGGTGTITITVTNQACVSINTSAAVWLTETSVSGGCALASGVATCTGNGTIGWTAAANGGTGRSTTITPDSLTSSFTATQAGVGAPTPTGTTVSGGAKLSGTVKSQ